MLKAVIHWSVNKRWAALALTTAIALFGVFSFLRTPIEAFPDVTNLQVNVITQSPGLSPEEIERQITAPLERALTGIPHARLIRSESLFGLSLIWVVFEDNADAFRSRTFVLERLLSADLPAGVQPEIAPDYTPLGKVLHYRLTSETLDPYELRTIQETTVSRALRSVPGVADIVSFGGYLKEIHIEVSPTSLAQFRITLPEVLNALEESNLNVGGGILRQGEQEYTVRSVGSLEDIEDLRKLPIRREDGEIVALGEVARFWQSHTPRRGRVSVNEIDEVVEGIVLMRRGENANDLLSNVKERIGRLNSGELPSDATIDVVYDRSVMLGRTLETVYTNLWHGAVLIIGICWLFLRILRGSLVVTAIIPLSLLTAFIGLYAIGLPANLISMGAIDFGILVDGAVVLVENIQHRMRHLRPRTRSEMLGIIRDAALEVSRPTFFALSIIIAAMLPIFALESVEGRLFRPLALTYVFALIGALVFSLTVVPALCAVVLKPADSEIREPQFVSALQRFYARCLRIGVQRAWLSLGAFGLLIVVASGLAGRLGSEFLPELDEGDIYIFAEAPTGIDIAYAAENFSMVRDIISGFDMVEIVLAEQGRPEDGTDNEGPNLAKIFVRLAPRDTWPKGLTKDDLIAQMRTELERLPGLTFNFSQPIKDSVEESVAGVRGKVVLKARGSDFSELRQTLLSAKDLLAAIDGVVDLDIYRDSIAPQLEIRLQRDQMLYRGVSVEDAQIVVQTALAGSIPTQLWENEREIPIRVLLPIQDRSDIYAIQSLEVEASDGTLVPLREIANISLQPSLTSITREHGARYLALKFNIEGRDSGTVVREAMQAVDSHITPSSSVTLEWGGEFENQQRAVKKLSVVVPIALLIVLALLWLAVGSAKIATIVLCTMPIGLSGGVFGLIVAGENLSVSAAVGFIALIGQISLLGLLMLSALKTRFEREPLSLEPLIEESSNRLRALLMTALLAALGLLPMAMSTGMGSETQRPFAAVIVGGMVTTLAGALFFMPLLFALLSRSNQGSTDTKDALR